MDVISTADVPAEERFAFWHELNGKLWAPYDLRCDPRWEPRFQAQVGVSDFGPVQATLITTMPHSVHRTPKLIRQTDPGMYKLGCFVKGGGFKEQDGRCVELKVGDLMFYDTSLPYLASFLPDVPESRLLLLRFPRTSLPLPERDLRQLTTVGIPGDRGVGALSSQFLRQLALRMDELGPADAARLSTLALDVLTAALANALDVHLPSHTRQRALTAEIHAFIQANLGDADLTPGAVAEAHHISLRYLYKLFQQDGHTVAGWIRERRLERCRRDLADPRHAARPINAIAARWGFTSPSHFSQAFRSAYGLSPREFRQQCAQAKGECAHT
ncbi:helix-turn-helix domain-containing protein [Actinomadura madurae]|uniref:helix-turn-helix domain-containing protein n=1 Tax=Actinomadura madurae TaxID=1993 RepID=UPI002026D7A9|nr:helix-turn-helix domain-containing protein [Actinomadura madurae]MCP9949748.1 helix-turn-helix domain-containing protein [Actinomadura madurae]MCP9978989.1 helix-turn-helix domain-containing protein [Actinomadura madurae]MCQ0015170.1 helix-turn-helix domain-containing protein [Actinomadura madurae]URM95330.1 helix-turn-helix domain-containing protein [Actinomadura madurae]URN06022.1 helix-turn-helix domain-containing protein [Actinomadura madurae]